MEMLRLNVRHQLPQTDFRVQYGKIDRARMIPAEVHTNLELGKSNQGATQPEVQLDNYPSRRAWGIWAKGNIGRSRRYFTAYANCMGTRRKRRQARR